MARTHKYLNHLLQHVGITPACSEEERAAAELIAGIYRNHGFEPEIQEFDAPTFERLPLVVGAVLTLLGVVLSFVGDVWGFIGFVFAGLGCALFVLDKLGRTPAFLKGPVAPSQNVIAYHKATGPLASPRNRPVVVVAHYDSPRTDLLFRPAFARLRPIVLQAAPVAAVVAAAALLLSLFPFPGAAGTAFKVIALLAALLVAFYAATILLNKFVLPYTTGSVCNKSSLAALLGVMDAVSPFPGGEEFPDDVPFEDFRATHMARRAEPEGEEIYLDEDAERADVEGSEGSEPAEDLAGETDVFTVAPDLQLLEDDLGATFAMDIETMGTEVVELPVEPAEDESDEHAAQPDEASQEGEPASEEAGEAGHVNAAGNFRYGAETIRSLGMVSEHCKIVYEEGDDVEVSEGTPRKHVARIPSESDEATSEPTPAEDEDSADDELAVFANLDFGEEEDLPEEELPAGEEALVELPAAEAEADGESAASDEPAEEAAPAEEPADTGEGSEPADNAETDGEKPADAVHADEEPEKASRFSSELASFDPSEVDTPVSFDSHFPVLADGSVEEPEEDASPASREVPASVEPAAAAGSTQRFTPDQLKSAQDAAVEALMREISPQAPEPTPAPVQPTAPAAPAAPAQRPSNPLGRRSALFDLPDPSAAPSDPFAAPSAASPAPAAVPSVPQVEASSQEATADRTQLQVIDGPAASAPAPASQGAAFEVISAPQPKQEKPRRGLGKLFGRKKQQEESMGDWLGVGDDFDAKSSGRDIGTWDNFEDDGWKGGAASADGASEEDMVEAIASMGDDELLGHDIWFVATGASECGQAGAHVFLDAHRDKLRGVFLINLDSVGAGEPSILVTEGSRRVYKGDRRIAGLLNQVSGDFHRPFSSADMPCLDTDATAAMVRSLRSATVAGVEDGHLACSHCELDLPENVSPENVATVAEVVTEVIRRS